MTGMTQSLATSASSLPRSWGVAPVTRVLLWLVLAVCGGAVVLFVLWGLVIPPPDGGRGASLAMAAMPAACGLFFWRFGIYPRVTATPEGVTVRNPFVTRRVAWTEIREVRPGYSGLEIQRADGGVTTVWAVQQANLSAWLRRPTRAKAVAGELMRISEERNAR